MKKRLVYSITAPNPAKYISSVVHTGFGHGCKRINKSRLDCLEHNDSIIYIHC